jgi:hypothetical protein
MKRLKLLLALAFLAAGVTQADGRNAGPGLGHHAYANPSAVIAAEIAFNQLAQRKGQWSAFRATAADGAEMFVPQRVRATDWLKHRADPSVSVKWQAFAVWSSCDGSYAATRGAWERPGSAGTYVTVWKKQKDGKYKWLLDMSVTDETARAAPDMVAGRVADCGRSREQLATLATGRAARQITRVAYLPVGGADVAAASSDDGTLRWETRITANGARRIILDLFNGRAFDRVVDTGFSEHRR